MSTAVHNPEWRLRRGFTAPTVVDDPHSPLYTGQFVIPREPSLGLDLGSWHKPQLKLGDYIDWANAQPPAAVSRPHAGFGWAMLANDRLGDCVVAMKLHSIEEFHLDANTAQAPFNDADAVLWYQKDGNYNPNDPSTDQGCDESQAMKNWEAGMPQTSDGLVHQIEGTVSVDPTNLVECRIAIYEFIALQVGIALPLSAQGQPEWAVVGNPSQDPNSQPGSWGGHGIPFREYDAETFKCITWGAELLLTVPFHVAYSQEAHVVLTKEMLNSQQTSPTGLQWPDLLSDLAKLAPAAAEPEPIPQPRPKPAAPSQPAPEPKTEASSDEEQEEEEE